MWVTEAAAGRPVRSPGMYFEILSKVQNVKIIARGTGIRMEFNADFFSLNQR
jgi:hypothetical protein